ncbi:hypothetical protein DH2020_003812 [Rehmannia glutinosa]|uniref:DUF7733 domain-containing protein n=1 Tax=Rehmannia glutinosa TaxID=99300 RepID=A0ABR0XMN4_REHGL
MSGVSLAVDRTSGSKPVQRQQQQTTSLVGVMGSLRVIELQLVAFIMVFSASGLVPLVDLVFPAMASAYFLALSRFAFPSHGKISESPQLFHGSRLFRLYVIIGTTVGLFLPLAYVLGGFARGDDQAVRSATPHLFLLSFQILTENIITGLSLFSPPVRALVPLVYTGRRIFVIFDWMKDVVAWYWFGRVLSIANFVYFAINLFCFLIPRFLPRAFERYFKERDEMYAKMAEDKSSAAFNTPHNEDKKVD